MTCFQRSATARCTAMPPPRESFRPEKSSWANPGVLRSPAKSVFTPDSDVKRYFAISATKPFMSRGLVMRMLCAASFMYTRQQPVSAKMWYIGSAVIEISLPGSKAPAIHAITCCRLATMLPWVSIAPLETPVVPPVYWRNARSAWPTLGSTSLWRAPPKAPC